MKRLTTGEVARLLHLSENVCRLLVKRGDLGTRTPGKASFIYSTGKVAQFAGITPDELEQRICAMRGEQK